MTQQEQRKSLLGKIAAYTEILAKDSGSTIFVSLAEAYRKMGMLDDAKQIIEHGLETHLDFSPAHVVLARVFCQLGDYEQSEKSFAAAIEFDSDSLAALVGFARLNILIGQEEKARQLLVQARNLSPADAVINKLLLSLPQEGAPDEDLETPDQGTNEESETVETAVPLASSTLADLYLKQGLKQQALDIFRQLTVEDPNNLVLRRQIRELEEELNGDASDSSGAAQPEEVVTGESTTTEVDPISTPAEEITAEPEPDHVVSTLSAFANDQIADDSQPAVAAGPSAEKILSDLNIWLDNIRQRREHV